MTACGSRWRSLRPELDRLWIRHAFEAWPATRRRWLDLARGTLSTGTAGRTLPAVTGVKTAPGLLYVPPAEEELEPRRQELLRELAGHGQALLVQCLPDVAPPSGPGVEVVADLSEALLARDLEALAGLASIPTAIWPLVPGITDAPRLWEEGCRRLAAAGVRCVQPIAPRLEPRLRRRLAEAGADGDADEVFGALFHGSRRRERDFARCAAVHGLGCVFRPRRRGQDRTARHLELAELLALGAEVWLRLGRSEARGQELFRASRWVETATTDVRALVREGNLPILGWLEEPAGTIVREWAQTGGSATVEAWVEQYRGGR